MSFIAKQSPGKRKRDCSNEIDPQVNLDSKESDNAVSSIQNTIDHDEEMKYFDSDCEDVKNFDNFDPNFDKIELKDNSYWAFPENVVLSLIGDADPSNRRKGSFIANISYSKSLSENMRNIFNFIRNNISFYQARPSPGSHSTPVDWRADALPLVYGHLAKGKRKFMIPGLVWLGNRKCYF